MTADLSEIDSTTLYNEISTGQRLMDWILLGYEQGSNRKIKVLAKDDGGIEAMATHLNEKMIGYAYIKIPAENSENANDVDFVHLTFIGNQVKPQERARSVVHRLDIQQEFPRFLTEFECNGVAEVTRERLEEEVNDIRMQLNS